MILGVDKSASTSDIKRAYHALALRHHPDKGGDAEKFKEVQKAYEALTEALKDRPERITITRENVFEDVTGPSPTLLGKKYNMEQAPKTGWQGAPRSTVNTETHWSRRRASAQASHHAPAASPPEIRRRAPPGYEMPFATADRSIWFFQGPRRCYGGPVLVLLLYAGKGLWLLHPSVAATSKGETLESNSLFGTARLRPIAN